MQVVTVVAAIGRIYLLGHVVNVARLLGHLTCYRIVIEGSNGEVAAFLILTEISEAEDKLLTGESFSLKNKAACSSVGSYVSNGISAHIDVKLYHVVVSVNKEIKLAALISEISKLVGELYILSFGGNAVFKPLAAMLCNVDRHRLGCMVDIHIVVVVH